MAEDLKGKGKAVPEQDKAAPAEEYAEDGGLDREPVFYYSRERRLARASERVRELNEGEPVRPGLRRGLFSTKGNLMLFLSIIVVCAALFAMTSRFSTKEKGVKLGGNTLSVEIQREEGVSVLRVVKNAPESGEVYLGAVDIAVSPAVSKAKASGTGEIPVFTHRVYFNPVDSESWIIALPFTESSFFVIFRAGGEQKSVRL